MYNNKKNTVLLLCLLMLVSATGNAAEKFVSFTPITDGFELSTNNKPVMIAVDADDHKGVMIAANNLCADFGRVTGQDATISSEITNATKIIIGSVDKSSFIRQLIREKKINGKELEGKREKYLITTVSGKDGGKDAARRKDFTRNL